MVKHLFYALLFLSAHLLHASALVYVPENFNPATARVVVVIHGCYQTPESMALGTGWNQKADQNNLVMIYPQVPTGSNPIDCWNWYLPENQNAKVGQLSIIHGEIENWKSRLKIEKAPVFVTGISSGAATVSGLLACFPADFRAGAIHSGLSFGLASNLRDAEDILKNGVKQIPASRACSPSNFKKPVMVIHGSADKVVNPVHVQTLVEDFLGHAIRTTTDSGAANGLKYTTENYIANGRFAGRVVMVEGLEHAWAGHVENLRHPYVLGPGGKFPTHVPFFSAQGPSSTNLIWEFFNSVPK